MVAVRGSTATSASRRGRLAACAAARPPAGPAPGRRDALLGASAAAVATVQLPGLLMPAAAQALVSGYTPDDGTTTTVTAFHDTPNAAKWYKDVFSGARAAVDAGELGDEMASTFRWLIASEVGGDGIMVTAVMPKGNAKAFEDFYNPKNPLWAKGKEEGWLTGPYDSPAWFTTEIALFRGAKPGPPPSMKGKGLGLFNAGSKLAFDEWTGLFTSPDSDKLHAAAGIVNSVAGKTVGSSGGEGNVAKGITVWHFHSSPKKADAFAQKFIQHSEPPFSDIVSSGAITEPFFAKPYKVIDDIILEAKLPKA